MLDRSAVNSVKPYVKPGKTPVRLVTVALANKMARIAWAVMTSGEVYREPQHKQAGYMTAPDHAQRLFPLATQGPSIHDGALYSKVRL